VRRKNIRFYCFRVLLLGMILIGSTYLCQADESADTLLFSEAVDTILRNSLKPDTSKWIIQNALRLYLRQLDVYSDYLPPDEYSVFKRAQRNHYAGIGMEILLDFRDNKIHCSPFPGSPAKEAGINCGDTLLQVDGRDISKNMSIFSIGALIRGENGTPINLLLQKSSGDIVSMNLLREKIIYKSVVLKKADPVPVIQISNFSNKTDKELKSILINMGIDRPKIIDLRGNTGGDLFSAIKCASLFISHDKRIVELKMKSKTILYKSTEKPIDPDSKLFIWQDDFTASASEVFIAAITQNKRGVSIGLKSHGKGVAQKLIELSDGSAIIITYATLHPPNGESFHKKGLKPDYLINSDIDNAEDAYAKTVWYLLNMGKS
jgi:carboxyl-terminal processing protease